MPMTGQAITSMRMPAPSVPRFSAVCGFAPSRVRTKNVPRMLAAIPNPASTSGSATNRSGSPAPSEPAKVTPRTIPPMIAPT